jgi:hypothetical protein
MSHFSLAVADTASLCSSAGARAQVNLPSSEFIDQGNLNKTCTKPVLRASAPARRLDLLLRWRRVARMVLWEAWFDLVERSRLAAAERRALLRCGSEFFFRYEELLGDYLTAE